MTFAPKLAKPGAGLPFLEGLIVRHIIYPTAMRNFSWQGALQQMQEETGKIAQRVSKLDEKTFQTPVLIDRLRALEDSSRFWSVAMAVRHLIITMQGMTAVAETLAAGKDFGAIRGTADVKPETTGLPPRDELLAGFIRCAEACHARLAPLEKTANNQHTATHPFFGKIPAKGWVFVLGAHQKLHRVHIQKILQGLPQTDKN